MLKLEKEEGLRVKKHAIAGQKTLSVVHVRDLMLTNKTRVFKAALVVPTEDGLLAWACDAQRQGGESVADFFLLSFLGAKLVAKPEVLTRDFMDAVERWIKTEVPDAEAKSRYQVALMAEMSSNRLTVTPTTFAEDNLDPADRDALLASLNESGAPLKRFPKNTNLVRNRLRKIQFDLEGQIAVICPPQAVGEAVRISGEDQDGETLMWIKGRLQGVRGKGR